MADPRPRRAAARKDMELALRDSEERLRAILDTAVEGIITIDERGIIESVNPAAQKLFGYSAAEMQGRNISMLMPQPYSSEHDRYLENYARTGRGKIIGIGREVMGRRKDGTLFPMDLSVGEVRLTGERFFTGIVRDITERKRLEKEILEISDREQRRIGHDLHDDLCQHLAAIGLMSEVLEHKLDGTAHASEARRIAERVQSAIEKTRRMARGLSPLEMESSDLIAALTELASTARKTFSIACSFRAEIPAPVNEPAISTHLYRIAQEALGNAIKHGRAEEVSIILDARGGEVLLKISDDGIGFPGKKGSTGMGLRTMRYRAGMIGGTLEVDSAPHGGTTVTCRFRLPEA